MVVLKPDSILEWFTTLNGVWRDYNIVHIQYPMEGWGTSPLPGLVPGLVKLFRFQEDVRLITTLHEWASMHALRKASVLPLLTSSTAITFSNLTELAAFSRFMLRAMRFGNDPLLLTIPISTGVEVPYVRAEAVIRKRQSLFHWNDCNADMLIGYFGFLYDSKQPEHMLRAVKALHDNGINARLVLAGDFPRDHQRDKCEFLRVIELLDLQNYVVPLGYVADTLEVALTMAACDVALLLFSDGLSARRSSFWWLYELGVPIVTTEPRNLLETAEQIASPLVDVVPRSACPADIAEKVLQKRQRQFLVPVKRELLGRRWDSIGAAHLDLYGLVCY